MTNIKRFTDDEITALNAVRKRPCITEGGECFIVSCYRIVDIDEHIEITDKTDVNVFATEAEANEWVAKMAAGSHDSVSDVKHVRSVCCHQIF